MKFSINNSCIGLLCLSAQSVFAANFGIQALAAVPLPTTITPGHTVVAYFTVTNNQNFPLNDYQVRGMPDTVVHNSTGTNYYNSLPICTNPINLGANASCLLQLDIIGPVDPSSYFAICKGNSCTSSGEPLHVKSAPAPLTARTAYITQYPPAVDHIIVCDIDPGTQLLGTCKSAGGGTLVQISRPSGIRFNNAGSTAFLTVNTGGAPGIPVTYQCPVYSNTGMLGTCTATTITNPSGFNSFLGFLTLSPDNTLAYLPDNDTGTSRVTACPIVNNAIGSNCTDTGSGDIGQATGIATALANTYAFMGSSNNYVTTCEVSGTVFSNCGQKTGPAAFAGTIDIAVNNTNTIAYITDNSSNAVYACTFAITDTAMSSFGFCSTAGSAFANSPWGIALNAASTMAYITSASSDIYECPIIPGGNFGACTTNSTFTQAVDIALFY